MKRKDLLKFEPGTEFAIGTTREFEMVRNGNATRSDGWVKKAVLVSHDKFRHARTIHTDDMDNEPYGTFYTETSQDTYFHHNPQEVAVAMLGARRYKIWGPAMIQLHLIKMTWAEYQVLVAEGQKVINARKSAQEELEAEILEVSQRIKLRLHQVGFTTEDVAGIRIPNTKTMVVPVSVMENLLKRMLG